MANKKSDINIHSSAAEYLTYVAAVGDSTYSMEMRYEDEIQVRLGVLELDYAELHEETEYEKYRIVQDKMFMSDYDRFLLEFEE